MSQDDFLVEHFKPEDLVRVDAIELQGLIKHSRQMEEQLLKALQREERLQDRLMALEAKIEIMEINAPMKVDLVV